MQYLVSNYQSYILKDNTSECSTKMGAYQSAFLTFLNRGSSTNRSQFAKMNNLSDLLFCKRNTAIEI